MTHERSPLGRATTYPDRYDATLLYRIERSGARAELGIGSALPFSGLDIWTAYELNWLDRRGKPHIAVAEIRIEAQSPAIVESKHMTRAGWATCGPSLGQHTQRAARLIAR